MSVLAKRAVFITVLIVIPMMAVDALLRNLHIKEIEMGWQTLIVAGVVLALVIALLWVRTNKNNKQPKP